MSCRTDTLIQGFRECKLFIDIKSYNYEELLKLIPIFEKEEIQTSFDENLEIWLRECVDEGWEYLGYSKNGHMDAWHKPQNKCEYVIPLHEFIYEVRNVKKIEIETDDVTNIFSGSV